MREWLLAHFIMMLAVVCGVGSLALFVGFPVGSQNAVRMQWPESWVLWWDGFLSLAFFVQHSGMVRRQFRARISGAIPPRYHRADYSIPSGLVLASVAMLWQSSDDHLLVLEGPLRLAAHAGALLAISSFIWGVSTLRGFDLSGLRSIRTHLRGAAGLGPVFVVQGPYRWVQHPWYLGAVVLFWSCPDLTADRLLFNVLWTPWICIEARLEEAELLAEFGDVYDGYRRQVPMLIPWRGRLNDIEPRTSAVSARW
jgi:methanethiol S-methyltransferase